MIAACNRAPADPTVVHGVVESRRIEAGSKTGGRVAEVLVREGETVDAGAVLVRFDSAEQLAAVDLARARTREAEFAVAQLRRGLRREEIEQAEAAAARARAQWESVKAGPRREEIEQARAEARAIDAEVRNAETELARVTKLVEPGDLPRRVADDARARAEALRERRAAIGQRVKLLEAGAREEDVRAAREAVTQAEKAAAVAKAGPRAEEIARAEARVEQAKAELAAAETRLAEFEVRAPARCRVETVAARPGDLIPAGRPLITLIEEDQTWVRVYVPEPMLPRWRVGGPAEAALESAPDQWSAATVEQIAAQSEFLPRNVQTSDDRARQVFAVKLRVPSLAMRSGMAARARPQESR